MVFQTDCSILITVLRGDIGRLQRCTAITTVTEIYFCFRCNLWAIDFTCSDILGEYKYVNREYLMFECVKMPDH